MSKYVCENCHSGPCTISANNYFALVFADEPGYIEEVPSEKICPWIGTHDADWKKVV